MCQNPEKDSVNNPTLSNFNPNYYGWDKGIQQLTPTQDLSKESWVRLEATNTRQAFTDQVIRFEFDQIGMLDPKSVFLTFNVQNTGYWNGGSRNVAFSSDIRSVFSRMRLLYGRTCILEDIQDYGSFCNLVSSQRQRVDEAFTSGAILNGTATLNSVSNLTFGTCDRSHYHNHNNSNITNAPLGNVPRRYIIRLNCGLFEQEKWLPLFNMQEKLILELTVADPRWCSFLLNAVNAGVSGPNAVPPPNSNLVFNRGICVSLPEIQYRRQNIEPIIQTKLESMLNSNQVAFQYISFYHQRFPLNVYNKKHVLKVPAIKKRILYAVAFLRNDEERSQYLSDPMGTYCALDPRIGYNYTGANPNYDYDGPKRTLLRNYQWRYNGQHFPEKPIRVCEGAHNLSTAGTGSTVLDGTLTYTGIPVEAVQYANYVLKNSLYTTLSHEAGVPGLIDNFGPNIVQFSKQNNTGGNSDAAINSSRAIRAYISSLPIVGKFYTEHMDGSTIFALDGTTNNGCLELILDFNDAFRYQVSELLTFPGNEPKMVVDVWVAYDSILNVDINNNIVLDQ